ncbi:MAG: substrate-binding domain-containing protein [Chitinophagaceae bacterium]
MPVKKKRTTITDIATHFGISITAVSFILNNKAKAKGISDALSKKVLKFAGEVNYRPNALAKSFRTGKTNIIGLLIEDISNPFFATVARLIEERAYERGYRIIYCSTNNDTKKTKELIRMFHDQYVDGYIIAPPEGIETSIRQLSSDGKPVVVFDRYNSRFQTDQVIINNYESVLQAMQHLIDNGYRHIGFVTIESKQSQMTERYRAYQDIIAANGMKEYVLQLPFAASDHVSITAGIKHFCEEHPVLDALFFCNNYLGVYGLEAIKSLDSRSVSQFGIISFDDHDLFRLYSPTITVIDQPIEEMTGRILDLLFRRIQEGDSQSPSVETLKTQLVVRESSGPKK